MVREIQNKGEWDKLLKEHPGKVIAVDFSAEWCGPCKMIGPKFAALAEHYPGIVFIKVDVDKCSDVSQECKVSAMPTFMFFKDGMKLDELVGASEEKLKQLLDKYK